MWDTKRNRYICDDCDKLLTEGDTVILVQTGYLLDNSQSFEDDLNSPDFHYHEFCYVKKLRN